MDIKKILAGLIINASIGLGCARNLNYFPIEKPLVAGIDGLFSSDLHSVGNRLEQECNTPVVIEPVGFWYANMPEIRQARKQGRNIILIGYSAGNDQVRLTKIQCETEGIPIAKIIFIDPTYTISENASIPDNTVAYFSTAPVDFMSWARGDQNKFSDKRFLRGAHIGCVNWDNLGKDLIDEVRKYTKK